MAGASFLQRWKLPGDGASESGVVVVYFILSRLIYRAFSANLGLLCIPHPDIEPLV